MEIETKPSTTIENVPAKEAVIEPPVPDVQESLKKIGELCDELMEKTDKKKTIEPQAEVKKASKEVIAEPAKVVAVTPVTPPTEQKKETAVKKLTKPSNRNKTSDLSSTLTSVAKDDESTEATSKSQTLTSVARKISTPGDVPTTTTTTTTTSASPPKTTEKRRSRILETAEKFQNMNNQNNEKYKKFSIPGVSVGSFKKEFERKASLTDSSKKNVMEKQRSESIENDNEIKKQSGDIAEITQQKITPSSSTSTNPPNNASDSFVKTKTNSTAVSKSNSAEQSNSAASSASKIGDELNANDSKSSIHSVTMEEARRSMENSIALLKKARDESRSKDMDKLCMRTESVTLENDREKKLQAAREIIGNAIPPSRLIGIRKPPLYGLHGRSVSGGVISPQPTPRPYVGRQLSSSVENNNNNQVVLEKGTLWCFLVVRIFHSILSSILLNFFLVTRTIIIF
jgi:hypothetical protein